MKLIRLGLSLALIGLPETASAAEIPATSAELQIMTMVNEARVNAGLVPLRSDYRLWALADDRAIAMATSDVLSHDVGGPLGGSLDWWSIQWFGHGEVVAWTSAAPAIAARSLFDLWSSSAPHWSLLMSSSFNYLGVGTAYSTSGRTYSSIVFTEAKDRSGAKATLLGASVSGDDVRWRWSGADTPLQTHTSGLRDFAVQQRIDSGGWVTVSTATTSTSRTAINRARGHWYGLRVRARDQAGNSGPWSPEVRIWVP